jgi:tetratricopeptide (TPR) repeat protein
MITKNDAQSESIKERVARHLRVADIMIKESKFADAVAQVEVALELDPKNYYARSFLERARSLMERARQKKELEQPDAKDAKATLEDQRISQISLLLRTADQLIAAKKYKLAQQQVEKVFVINPQNYYAKSYDERITRLLEAEAKKLPGQPAPRPVPGQQPRVLHDEVDAPRGRGRLDGHRKVLARPGAPGQRQARRLPQEVRAGGVAHVVGRRQRKRG